MFAFSISLINLSSLHMVKLMKNRRIYHKYQIRKISPKGLNVSVKTEEACVGVISLVSMIRITFLLLLTIICHLHTCTLIKNSSWQNYPAIYRKHNFMFIEDFIYLRHCDVHKEMISHHSASDTSKKAENKYLSWNIPHSSKTYYRWKYTCTIL